MSDERYEYMELNEELSDKLDKARELIDDLRAEVERLRASQQWQPIETAPKDGSRVQTVVMPCPVAMGAFWRRSRWITDEGVTIHPTHWMPLPEPPAERGEG